MKIFGKSRGKIPKILKRGKNPLSISPLQLFHSAMHRTIRPDCPPWKNIGPDLLLSCWAITRTSLHNVYILEYLFIRTEQAGTYLCRHSSSIWFCPLFCPLPHLPYILPSFFALALALFFCRGQGRGQKMRAKYRANVEEGKTKGKIRGQKYKRKRAKYRTKMWIYLK